MPAVTKFNALTDIKAWKPYTHIGAAQSHLCPVQEENIPLKISLDFSIMQSWWDSGAPFDDISTIFYKRDAADVQSSSFYSGN